MSKIYVVGIGPGQIEQMTQSAKTAIENSDFVIGYSTYIQLLKTYFPEKQFLSSSMMQEVQRCKLVLEKACIGGNVSLVSSGDSGIYGMAGLMIELANESNYKIEVEVIPGVTALSAAGALLGAPIMHDFAVISLSDLLTPWELIQKRIRLAAQADFVISFYNPKSKKRTEHIVIAREELLKHKDKQTPVGIVRNVSREGEFAQITDLDNMLSCQIDMFTVLIVGNSRTYVKNEKMITPRGYNY